MMNQNTDVTRRIKFQRAVYKVLLVCLGRIYTRISKFRYERYTPESETFLLVGNHNMNLDPFQAVIATGSHMRFVSNDAILKSIWGPILKFFVGPIPRRRGADTDETVDLILKNLKAGISVAMYPESERSWDGTTQAISVKTAQLAKESGAGLITFATNGSYLRTPHWAKSKRSGKTCGAVVNEYTAEMLAEMSTEEVYEAICRDLKVNAFEFQRRHMFTYKGNDLAENAELVCYICPRCEAMGKMSSDMDILKCDVCGYSVKYSVYGFWGGEDVVFDNTADWSRWQKNWLHSHAQELKAQTKKPIIINENVKFYKAGPDGKMKKIVSNAKSVFYGDRIDIVYGKDITFRENIVMRLPLKGITKLGGFGNHVVTLTCDGEYYKIKCSENFISIYVYYGLWRVLTDREYY